MVDGGSCSDWGMVRWAGGCIDPSVYDYIVNQGIGGAGGGDGQNPPGVGVGGGSDNSQQSNDKTQSDCGETSGNPVVLYSGNKVEPELDFSTGGEMGLYLQRTYNHYWSATGLFGSYWISNFDYTLASSSNGSILWAQRPDGRRVKFVQDSSGTRWNEVRPTPVAYILANPDGSYTLHNEERGTERYNSEGYILERKNERGISWTFAYSGRYLQTVTHTSGRSVNFIWNGAQLIEVRDPAGNSYQYSYHPAVFGVSLHRLASATLPGAPTTTISYHYEDSRFPGALTGKSFNGVRYSTFSYNADGRAISTEHAGGVEHFGFSYIVNATEQVTPPPLPPPPGGYLPGEGGGGWCEYQSGEGRICYEPLSVGGPVALASMATASSTTSTSGTKTIPSDLEVHVTNPLGRTSVHHYAGDKKVATEGIETSNCPWSLATITYDENGNRDTTVDSRGNITDYDYDSHGHLLQKIEAKGQASSRTTTYGWDEINNRMTRRTVLGDSEELLGYTADGRLSSIAVKNLSSVGVSNQVRTTTYSYTKHANGMPASMTIDGPMADDDVTYAFSASGDLTSVRNGLGHTTMYSGYNALGQVGKVVSPNGAINEYTYDARGRRITTKFLVNGEAQTTSYTYDGAGRLVAVTSPDNVTISREYDAAGRVLREYQSEVGGTFAVKRYTYNNASLVTSVAVERTTAIALPTGVPVVTVSASGLGDFTVGWSAVSGAESYSLHQKVDGGSWTQVYAGTGRTKSFTSRPTGTYAFRARACNAEGCSAWSTSASIYVAPATPLLTAPATDNSGTFAVSWGAISGASSYRLEQRYGSGNWTEIYNSTGTSKAMSGLTNGSYEYRVRACNDGGCSSYSATRTTVVTFPPASPPTVNAPATDNNGAYAVTWTSVSTATRYELDQRKDAGSWSTIHNAAGTSKSVSGLTNGSHEYRVRACNDGGCSSYSATKTTVVTFPPASPPTVSAPGTDNDGAYAVTWTSVSTATRYELDQRKDAGSWSTIHNAAGTSKSVSGLTNGSYEYRVRACNDGGCSGYSAMDTTVVTFPPASPPTVSAPATDNNGAYAVTWTSVSTATRYELDQRKDAGSWSTIHSAAGTSKSVSGLTNGSYEYRVRACNDGGCSGYSGIDTTVVTFPPASPPTVTAPAADNNGAYAVTWTSVSTATRYELDQRKDAGSWSTIHNAAGTSKSVSGLTNGSYEYRVRACNEGGCSGYSNIDTTVVTHPPDGPTVSTPAADNNGAYSVSWSSVSTATEYRLEQRKNGGSWSQIYSGTGLSKAVSGLTNGTYDYRARACNAGGCSGYSATDTTVVTFPPSSAPTLTAPTSADTATNFTVSWTAVSTATAYELQMGFNGAGWTTVYNSSARSVTRSHNFDGSYDYRVRACNAGGCGPFSGVRRVQVVDIGGGGPCHEGVCPEPDAVNPIEEES
ncbi:hypothetical protein GCM10027359_16390 [Marilutibacter aestuarii]